MDASRFDAITKTLAAPSSRRVALHTIAASALAAGLSRLGLAEVTAGCKKLGQNCDKDKDCCNGLNCKLKKCACKRGAAKCGDACCSRGQQCTVDGNGAPICCAPETLCGGACCGRGQQCAGGGKEPPTCCTAANVCGLVCCPPDRLCVGTSPQPFDPPSDPNDLYKCICHDGFEEDKDGKCVCPLPCGDDCCEADENEVCCSNGRNQKQCVQLDSSDNNCGACGNTCPHDKICKGGKCVCPAGFLDCDGTCVRPNNDEANCGACGTQCSQDRICQGGTCVCADEFLACEGTCVLKKGGCCSDIDCWVYGDNSVCCSSPACPLFDQYPYQCVIEFPPYE